MPVSHKKEALRYLPFFIFLFGVVISFIIKWQSGIKIALNFSYYAKEMLLFLPLMFILIGVIDVWVPKEFFQNQAGKNSGLKGIGWMILLATLQMGPLYGAFPVAQLLCKKGCSNRNIFIYLGAFSTLKLPMLTFEIGFLGLKFSFLRCFFTIPIFIGIGFLMDKLMGPNYSLPEEI